MSLTPAANDPKRKEELARAKQNPAAFGADADRPEVVAKRHLPTVGGLAVGSGKAKVK